MEWTETESGLGWSYFISGDFMIEPEDLDIDHWSLWRGNDPILEGGLEELKAHAATLQ